MQNGLSVLVVVVSKNLPNTRSCEVTTENVCNVVPTALTITIKQCKEEKTLVVNVPFDTARHFRIGSCEVNGFEML